MENKTSKPKPVDTSKLSNFDLLVYLFQNNQLGNLRLTALPTLYREVEAKLAVQECAYEMLIKDQPQLAELHKPAMVLYSDILKSLEYKMANIG